MISSLKLEQFSNIRRFLNLYKNTRSSEVFVMKKKQILLLRVNEQSEFSIEF